VSVAFRVVMMAMAIVAITIGMMTSTIRSSMRVNPSSP
jgi:hypothetical protein